MEPLRSKRWSIKQTVWFIKVGNKLKYVLHFAKQEIINSNPAIFSVPSSALLLSVTVND